MKLSGWGQYPCVDAQMLTPRSKTSCIQSVMHANNLVARGLGRSYGDSSLAACVLDTRYLDHLLAFDETTGLLTCGAGTSLDTILSVFVPRGWFLPVTPGTRFITVGGAIASDVHGKNHHLEGTFTDHVIEIELLSGNGEVVKILATERSDLFYATCGGMGLTGMILSATLRLKPIQSSDMIQSTFKTPDLDAVLTAFAEHANSAYTVAWMDCLARGKNLGRALFTAGEHAQEGSLIAHHSNARSIPFNMPSGLLNRTSIKVFNRLYYGSARNVKQIRRVHYEPFFYPLDRLRNWTRLYGKNGFVQYQFVLPMSVGVTGLRDVLRRIAQSGRGSFLAVLKVFGKANRNCLSFPMEGYTLALDFKVESAVFSLLNELDRIVLHYGGRIYLAKDARMSEATFKQAYPRWSEFEETRARYGAAGKFCSLQSQRLGFK